MLNAVPRIRFLQPIEEDANGVLARMLEVSMNGVIRVGSYALRYTPIVDTLIWLRINRPDVTLKVLYHRHWCWTNHQAPIVLGLLYFFGVETRHTKSTGLHMKMIAVVYTYCFSGSANLGEAGFGGNVELNTVVGAASSYGHYAGGCTQNGVGGRRERCEGNQKKTVVVGGGDAGNADSNQVSSCHG
ncbi:hypothetical protein PHYPSEUDO_013116 [Phytophthora pseudosyringae]|uniref:Uncharacterized protein n=1 Tax=Phytophthora pseudosyringae TaxID=221518 RepID=A0A8T1VAM2_9STRA|nr:hypothetical protein PHYPSEUDO_013116 [Phytophthora pseudosyringae]